MGKPHADAHASGTSLTPSSPERRRKPRVHVMSRVSAQLVALDIPVTLVNISSGGFMMKSSVDFPVGTIATFRIVGRRGEIVVVRARAVHTMQAISGDTISYVIGLHFVEKTGTEGERVIAEIVSDLS
jgi:hypothetical protein